MNRRELIAAFEGRIIGGEMHHGEYIHVPQEEAEEILELLKAQEPQTVSSWVSVKDRLPGKNGRYLCRYEQDVDGKVCRCTDFGMFDSNIGEKGGWFVEKVAYWMQLPEPPKEDDA